MPDEDVLAGDFLKSICASLGRNSIKSLKRVAIIPDADELTTLKKPPQLERPSPPNQFAKGV
jgi:hypothetical protein